MGNYGSDERYNSWDYAPSWIRYQKILCKLQLNNDPLRGYRAYFAVNSGSSAPVRYGMPARIVEQQNTATAIADNAAASMPEKKLVNGELVISRGSSSYNVLGMTIR